MREREREFGPRERERLLLPKLILLKISSNPLATRCLIWAKERKRNKKVRKSKGKRLRKRNGKEPLIVALLHIPAAPLELPLTFLFLYFILFHAGHPIPPVTFFSFFHVVMAWKMIRCDALLNVPRNIRCTIFTPFSPETLKTHLMCSAISDKNQ